MADKEKETNEETPKAEEAKEEVKEEAPKEEAAPAEEAKEEAPKEEEAPAEEAKEEAPKEEPKAEKAPEKESPAPKEEKKPEPKKEITGPHKKLIETIKDMSVLELSELVKELEDVFGVSASAPMAVAAAPGGAAGGGAEEEKDSFNVMLQTVGDKKIQVIKEVRTITGLGLKEAKAVVDSAPKAVKEGVNKAEAEEIKGKLEAAGATVELQ